ncbi:hypothetical protein ACEQ8H_006111 [Pleosporales sp. CAS-2024a]
MLSTIVYLALVQLAYAASIPQTTQGRPVEKRLATGSKVAIGLCVPGAVLLIGLFCVVVCLYPSQLKKLRKQTDGRDITFSDLMTNGRAVPKPAAPPPPYSAPDSASINQPPGYANADAQPTTDAQARHAALMS